jgi:hypothetical protein
MPKKTRRPSTPTIRQQFDVAYETGDFATMVELARPIVARQLFDGGFEAGVSFGDGQELAGDLPSTIDTETLARQYMAGLALGVALGQLVTHEAFAAGAGAR